MQHRPPQPISGHCLPPRGQARPGLVREVPPPRRPPGQKANRPGLDGARPACRGLPHAPHRAGVASTRCWPKRAGASRRGWCVPARRSPTRSPSTCAGSSRTAPGIRRASRGYESIIRAHLLPAFGQRRLEDITADEVEAWSATLAARRAGLRPLRFHDLRHTFGTQVISNPAVSILQLKAWMGHADIDTTMKYLHYAPREGEADLIADAFASPSLDPTASRDGA